MDILNLNDKVTVSGQLTTADLEELNRRGVNTIVCNRPDGEEQGQTPFVDIRNAAKVMRMEAIHIPFFDHEMGAHDVDQLANLMKANRAMHLYSKSGERSSTLWAMSAFELGYKESAIIQHVNNAGYRLDEATLEELISSQVKHRGSETKLGNGNRPGIEHYDALVVGGGSAGLSICASLRKRDKHIKIAVIEPSHTLYYQPGWTMVGGGVFAAKQTKRHVKNHLAKGVRWIQQSVEFFLPDRHLVQLDNDKYVHYQQLVIAPGLELHWEAIEGLSETLGRNGVTSNYRYDLAPYTWELVQKLKKGNAIFTQPPMPIKCAGAPQKAMYLSSDYWHKHSRLRHISVGFFSAGDAIFGVKDYVPALNNYLDKYGVDLNFKHNLTKVDGAEQIAYFSSFDDDGNETIVASPFDMLHVCPPQRAPKFIRDSDLSDEAGWLDVDQSTLAHTRYANIWGIGDVINAPNAKTLAAVRKQVPVVAENLIRALHGKAPSVAYSGYGSCPLTVERGKIILAEFIYGGKHSPTFPEWMNDGTEPTRFAWFIKTKVLPFVYWKQMLRGIEWLVKPEKIG